jgi:dehydrogenase/reductase SDR family protein 12
MSSGGMYTAELTVNGLQLDAAAFNGSKQYALAKRAQVTLNELWSERVDRRSVVFHSTHPGWADTPGVEESLPTFRKIVGPLLRDAAGGADTMVWLAADDGEPLATTGGFWLDRRIRTIHRLRNTRRSDTPERRTELWNWVTDRAGCSPPTR